MADLGIPEGLDHGVTGDSSIEDGYGVGERDGAEVGSRVVVVHFLSTPNEPRPFRFTEGRHEDRTHRSPLSLKLLHDGRATHALKHSARV